MRPVTVNNPGYVRAATILITADADKLALAAVGIFPNFGTLATFNIPGALLPFLVNMTTLNAGQEAWAGLTAVQRTAVKLLITKFTDSVASGYGSSRWALLQNYGQLCAYCEMPVMDYSLAVEHILPKDQFPDVMLDYINFFLSCPSCNSVKKSRPTYIQGRDWAINQQMIPVPNYVQVKGGGIDRFVWPTTVVALAPAYTAYTAFTLTLFQVGVGPITDLNALNSANAWTSTNNNQVTATVGGVSMLVTTDFAPSGALIPAQRAANLIEVVDLNRAVPGTVVSDRRMVNRTVNWFDANTAMARLTAAYANDTSPGKVVYRILLDQVIATIRIAGFYSTWAKVLFSLSPPVNPVSVYTVFKNMTGNNTLPQYYIPGTNAAAMP